MKYPRLPDADNLSRKLSQQHVDEIQQTYQQQLSQGYTPTSIRNRLAQHYNVSYATIYYWTSDKYRQEKRSKNNAYWSEIKTRDHQKWLQHKTQEIQRRKKRMERNPQLKLWHEVVGAHNEKRVQRKTVKGKPLESYDDK